MPAVRRTLPMQLLPWTTLALAFISDDLFITRVVSSAAGVREQRVAKIAGFSTMKAVQAREALVPHRPSRSDRVCVLLPAAMVSARSVPIGCASWGKAHQELLASVEKLLPLEHAHAALGMVERVSDQDAEAGDDAGDASVGRGFLIGVDDRALVKLLEPIESAFNRRVDLVLSWHHALLGLGEQDAQQTIIYDETPLGVPVHHVLRYSALAQQSEPGHPAPGQADAALLMPSVTLESVDGPSASRVRRLDGYDLATAAALAEQVASGMIVPVRGKRRTVASRWVGPLVAAAVGAVLLVGAGQLHQARQAAELARIQRVSAEIADDFAQAEARQSRLMQMTAALSQIEQVWAGEDPQIIEAYKALRDAVPAEGYLYRVQIDGQRVTLIAEAPRAAAVLERVEGSPMFRGASMRPPSSVSERPGMERFEITAERVRSTGPATGSAATTTTGGRP